MPAPARTALVLGATGLVGGHCRDLLLDDGGWERVVALGRRPVDRRHPRLEQRTAGLDQLEAHADAFAVDEVFCSLGTTIRAAGSREAFRRVDHDYPLAAARLASGRGARHFLLVSALGADPRSRVFYNRVKGETERDVADLPFLSVSLLRPSLLLGERGEHRAGEALAQRLAPILRPLLAGPLRRYRAVEARTVARAMVRLAKEGAPGVRAVESDRIEELGA